MLSRQDLNSAELETVRVSKSWTTVVTASGEVQTNEEATVLVKALDLFVTIKFLEDAPAVLSHSENSAKINGHSYEWTSGQKPQLIKNSRKIDCNTANYSPFVVPGLSTRLFNLIFTYLSYIFIARNRGFHGASSINKK